MLPLKQGKTVSSTLRVSFSMTPTKTIRLYTDNESWRNPISLDTVRQEVSIYGFQLVNMGGNHGSQNRMRLKSSDTMVSTCFQTTFSHFLWNQRIDRILTLAHQSSINNINHSWSLPLSHSHYPIAIHGHGHGHGYPESRPEAFLVLAGLLPHRGWAPGAPGGLASRGEEMRGDGQWRQWGDGLRMGMIHKWSMTIVRLL